MHTLLVTGEVVGMRGGAAQPWSLSGGWGVALNRQMRDPQSLRGKFPRASVPTTLRTRRHARSGAAHQAQPDGEIWLARNHGSATLEPMLEKFWLSAVVGARGSLLVHAPEPTVRYNRLFNTDALRRTAAARPPLQVAG